MDLKVKFTRLQIKSVLIDKILLILDITIIVLESQKNEIAQRISKLPLQKLKYDFICLNQETQEDYGTADALRLVSEKIKSDVILISCDTITNIDFFPVLDLFRMNDASCVALFDKGSDSSSSSIIIPGPKVKQQKHEKDLVGIDSENNRLLFLASTTDFQENMSLPGHLLRSHGKMTIHSNLVDAHIYLLKKWVVTYLANSEKFSTVKGELLPFIIKKQLSRPSKNLATGFSEANFDTNDIFEHIKQNELDQKIIQTNLNTFTRLKRSHNSELIKCYAYIAPEETFCMRVNTLLNYCLANKKIFSIFHTMADPSISLVSRNATINSTQISDSAVAENTTISEKTSIKSSVFGINCNVDPKTRISDSILMNGAIVEERVVLENCIICDKAVIKQGSVLKNCLVGHNFVVKENTNEDRKTLSTGEGFMEI